ncbi:MAG: hypothetical protein IT458_18395 [Planctomycetes bacterium]|nr:hypothetical protein [Planctomycetota bacterium]
MNQGVEIAALCGWAGLGLLLAKHLVPRAAGDRLGVLLQLVLGLSLGLGGAAAMTLFEVYVLHGDPGACLAIRCLEAGYGLVLAILALLTARAAPARVAAGPPAPRWLLLVLAAVAAMAVALVVHRALQKPHGEYDTLAMWNLRARMLLRAPHAFTETLAGLPSFPHADYPPLWPAAVARLWRAAGADLAPVPLAACALHYAGAALVVAAALRTLRGGALAALGGILVLGAPPAARIAAEQLADPPLALHLAAASALLLLAAPAAPARAFGLRLLAGSCLGAAALTKNEGMAAAALVAATCAWGPARGLARLVPLGLGAAPFVAVLVLHLRAVPAANELLPFHRPGQVAAFLADPTRWLAALLTLGDELARFGKGLLVALVVIVVLLRRLGHAAPDDPAGAAARRIACALALLVALHLWIALTTPWPVAFHVRSTEARLLLQLWPSAVLALLALVRGEGLAAARAPSARAEAPA